MMSTSAAQPEVLPHTFSSDPGARFRLEGPLAERLEANLEHWLLPAPAANPGLLAMFQLRDQQPPPRLVPWAGEFAGKYLTAAVQALRLTRREDVREVVREVVEGLVAGQAEDGYLGPFPLAERLLGHWDLWGHYHCIHGLLDWHELTGDAAALECARAAADRVCATYHPRRGGRPVSAAGSPEMNMAILHGLCRLYRATSNPEYLETARAIEREWEGAGDYLRSGLDGREFFQSPRPRWESLHSLLGLAELHRITGDPRYRSALEHHWRSILRWDRRNTGGFTSEEQATGDPYAPTVIETCCTVAWMALTLEVLRLTGDPRCADELELATFNAAAGSQHPSGRWWTYNTPMDGVREASAHSIVFQARAGTPELNCCSVNGPRSLTMLAEWAAMRTPDGVVLNHLGPGRYRISRQEGGTVTLRVESDYPRTGKIRIRVEPAKKGRFLLAVRIPGWCGECTAELVPAGAGKSETQRLLAMPGQYLEVKRRWNSGDTISLSLEMPLRALPGAREAGGKVSLYRGPLLLAYDQWHNRGDGGSAPGVDAPRLREARAEAGREVRERRARAGGRVRVSASSYRGVLEPWLLVTVPAADGRLLHLCDYASAGAAGSRYHSWLPAGNAPPAPPVTIQPADGAVVPGGPVLFRWLQPEDESATELQYRLLVALDEGFTRPVLRIDGLTGTRCVLDGDQARALATGVTYFWQVVALSATGATGSTAPPARFVVDPALPPPDDDTLQEPPAGELVRAALRGTPVPEIGVLTAAGAWIAVEGPDGTMGSALRLLPQEEGGTARAGRPGPGTPLTEIPVTTSAGDTQRAGLRFDVGLLPELSASLALWVRMPEGTPGSCTLAAARTISGDELLSLVLEGGKVRAHLRAGPECATSGVELTPQRWTHLAAVKSGARLRLYVDGMERGATVAPLLLRLAPGSVAVGVPGVPVEVAALTFAARAFSPEEVAGLANRGA